MKLKHSYDIDTEIPEPVKPYYENVSGKWVLQTEETLIDKKKLDQFRDDAIAARKDRDKYKELWDRLEEVGITAEEATRLKSIETEINEQKLVKKGDLDKVIADRLAGEQRKFEKALTAERTKTDGLLRELEITRIEEAAVNEALKAGLVETAVEDLKARARVSLKLVEGRVHRLTEDGTVDPTSNGENVVPEWVKELKPKTPHLFKGNSGGGGASHTPGRSRTPIDETRNPWSRGENFNLTMQGRIAKENPAKAKQMMEAAGVPVNR